MTTAFIIVISIILIFQVIGILSLVSVRAVVKAGCVSKFYWRYKLLFGKQPKEIISDGKKVNVASYVALYVYGNSMKDYNIYNGQEVFVEPLDDAQKENLNNFPVLVFHIHNTKVQSEYKLRKFVSYIESPITTNWEDIFSKLESKIKISKEKFESERRNKTNKLTNPTIRHILSETYDEDTHTYRYSMHPVSSLYAKALYTVNI